MQIASALVDQHPLLSDWGPAVATGTGPMPGVDVLETARVVRDELTTGGGVPFLAELPARGPGADRVGRALGLMAGLWPAWAVETTPTGWRLCDAPGRDNRRAQGYWSRDLDVLEEVYDGWTGPLLLPLCGPWTLAAAVELRSGERVLRDEGAVRDLLAGWAEAAAAHLIDVRRRLPRCSPVLCADEPALPLVLAGQIPTASGAMRYRAVERGQVRTALAAAVTRLAGERAELLVHCGAAGVPLPLLREAGAGGVLVDLAALRADQQDQLGEAIEAGQRIGLGLARRTVSEVGASVTQVNGLGHRLGFAQQDLAAALILTSTGLPDLAPGEVGTELARVRAVGRALREEGGPSR